MSTRPMWLRIAVVLLSAVLAAEASLASTVTPSSAHAPVARPASPATASPAEWRALIDAYWGAGPFTPAQELQVFNSYVLALDRYFACFPGLPLDHAAWVALKERYLTELRAGVSYGRFTAIMNHLALALRESGTFVSTSVDSTPLAPGVPVMVAGGWGDNGAFGAGLTPLPDSSLLVYRTIPDHPLGLEPGDVVLGYDGVPWRTIYPRLLDAELPITGQWGSCPSAFTHSMLISAGLNWHLFDTLDVVKRASGDTLHLPVAPLAGAYQYLSCTEQLPVPGAPLAEGRDSQDGVSWGILTGTGIGYVDVRTWAGDSFWRFDRVLDTLLTRYTTTGLILDLRACSGGDGTNAWYGLQRLFGPTVATVAWDARCSVSDPYALCPSYTEALNGTAVEDYDRPIAVLVGPGTMGSGDKVVDWLRDHPSARFFGQPPAGAAGTRAYLRLLVPGVLTFYADRNRHLPATPGVPLVHLEFPVDEPVWLTPETVAIGYDNVVRAAVQWISGGPSAADGLAPRQAFHPATPNPFLHSTQVRFSLGSAATARMAVYDVSGRLVRVLLDAPSLPAGEHVAAWDGRDADGDRVPPGLYLCRLVAGERVMTSRIVRLR